MRAFFYAGKTTQHPKGVCFFAVRVVPGGKGMKVVGFGPVDPANPIGDECHWNQRHAEGNWRLG